MNTSESAPKTAKTEPARVPLGCRHRDDVNATVERIVGKEHKTPVLDVAAFQSFAE